MDGEREEGKEMSYASEGKGLRKVGVEKPLAGLSKATVSAVSEALFYLLPPAHQLGLRGPSGRNKEPNPALCRISLQLHGLWSQKKDFQDTSVRGTGRVY